MSERNIAQRLIERLYDGDSLRPTREGDKVVEPGVRFEGYDSPELKNSAGQVTYNGDLARRLTESLLSKGSTLTNERPGQGGHGRTLATFEDEEGNSHANDLIAAGMAQPFNGNFSEKEQHTAQVAGNLREILGRPRTNNETINEYSEQRAPSFNLDAAADLISNKENVYDTRGTFDRSLDRGWAELATSLGGAINYLGDRMDSDVLREYGKEVFSDGMRDAELSAREIETFDDIDSGADILTYGIETIGEMLPGLLPDIGAAALTGGGSLLASAGRRIGGAALKKRIARSAAVGAGASAGAQGLGGMEAELEAEGSENNPWAPLAMGAVTGAANTLPVGIVLDRVIGQIGDDVLKKKVAEHIVTGLKTAGIGAGAEFAASGVESFAQQVIKGLALDRDVDVDYHQVVDDSLRGLLGGGMMAGTGQAAVTGGDAIYQAVKNRESVGTEDGGWEDVPVEAAPEQQPVSEYEASQDDVAPGVTRIDGDQETAYDPGLKPDPQTRFDSRPLDMVAASREDKAQPLPEKPKKRDKEKNPEIKDVLDRERVKVVGTGAMPGVTPQDVPNMSNPGQFKKLNSILMGGKGHDPGETFKLSPKDLQARLDNPKKYGVTEDDVIKFMSDARHDGRFPVNANYNYIKDMDSLLKDEGPLDQAADRIDVLKPDQQKMIPELSKEGDAIRDALTQEFEEFKTRMEAEGKEERDFAPSKALGARVSDFKKGLASLFPYPKKGEKSPVYDRPALETYDINWRDVYRDEWAKGQKMTKQAPADNSPQALDGELRVAAAEAKRKAQREGNNQEAQNDALLLDFAVKSLAKQNRAKDDVAGKSLSKQEQQGITWAVDNINRIRDEYAPKTKGTDEGLDEAVRTGEQLTTDSEVEFPNVTDEGEERSVGDVQSAVDEPQSFAAANYEAVNQLETLGLEPEVAEALRAEFGEGVTKQPKPTGNSDTPLGAALEALSVAVRDGKLKPSERLSARRSLNEIETSNAILQPDDPLVTGLNDFFKSKGIAIKVSNKGVEEAPATSPRKTQQASYKGDASSLDVVLTMGERTGDGSPVARTKGKGSRTSDDAGIATGAPKASRVDRKTREIRTGFLRRLESLVQDGNTEAAADMIRDMEFASIGGMTTKDQINVAVRRGQKRVKGDKPTQGYLMVDDAAVDVPTLTRLGAKEAGVDLGDTEGGSFSNRVQRAVAEGLSTFAEVTGQRPDMKADTVVWREAGGKAQMTWGDINGSTYFSRRRKLQDSRKKSLFPGKGEAPVFDKFKEVYQAALAGKQRPEDVKTFEWDAITSYLWQLNKLRKENFGKSWLPSGRTEDESAAYDILHTKADLFSLYADEQKMSTGAGELDGFQANSSLENEAGNRDEPTPFTRVLTKGGAGGKVQRNKEYQESLRNLRERKADVIASNKAEAEKLKAAAEAAERKAHTKGTPESKDAANKAVAAYKKTQTRFESRRITGPGKPEQPNEGMARFESQVKAMSRSVAAEKSGQAVLENGRHRPANADKDVPDHEFGEDGSAPLNKGQTRRANNDLVRAAKRRRKYVKPLLAKLVRSFHTRMKRIHPGIYESVKTFIEESAVRVNAFAADLHKVLKNDRQVRKAYTEATDGEDTKGARHLRKVFADIDRQMQEVDPSYAKHRKDSDSGLPVAIKAGEAASRKEELVNIFKSHKLDKPEEFVEAIVSGNGFAQFSRVPGKNPVQFGNWILNKSLPDLREAGFVENDGADTVYNAMVGAAKRMEFVRVFSQKDTDDNFSRSGKLDAMMDEVHPRNRGEAERLMQAVTGEIQGKAPPWLRLFNSTALAFQTATVLLFSGVASLPEVATVYGRKRDVGMGEVTKDFRDIFSNSTRKQQYAMAEEFGTAIDHGIRDTLLSVWGMDEMTVGKFNRRMAQTMFKYNGQEMLTRFTRVLATHHGRGYLKEHAEGAKAGNARSKRALEELKIDADTVLKHFTNESAESHGDSAEYQKFRDALNRYVNQSVAIPNAGSLPMIASDPRYAILTSLKKFYYGYWDRVHKALFREFKARRSEDSSIAEALAPAMTAALVALPMAALAETIRELWKDPMDQREKDDWLYSVLTATGGLGPLHAAQAAYDATGYGRNFAVALAGPTVDFALNELATGNVFTNNPSRAMPVVSQTPWMRSPVNRTWKDIIADGE